MLAIALHGCGDDGNAQGEEDTDTTGLTGIQTITNGDTEASDGVDPFPDIGSGVETDGNGGDCPGGPGGMPGDEYKFSIIWISNTGEGTVSKIDTVAAVELARYRTGPDDNPDPSRTSVNLHGDVAVANRSGSVTKIASEESRCVDLDNNGTIETSQGPDDILPWGEDECVLWYHDIPFDQGVDGNTGGPRGIAWDAGEQPHNPCANQPDLWVGWRDQPNETAKVRRIDGQTGIDEGEVEIPDWQGNWGHGTYGGAADADGAFWGLGTLGTLIKVDPDTLEVTRWDNPDNHVVYGIALDKNGDPWLAGWGGKIWWFDRAAEQFTEMGDTAGGPSRMRGLAIDKDGHAWLAGNNPCGLVRYDTVAQQLLDGQIDLPGCDEPVGVSIDADGFVWVVDRGASVAYKVDPDDYASIIVVEGLVSPYTYSDMTGAGLDLVVNPPAG